MSKDTPQCVTHSFTVETWGVAHSWLSHVCADLICLSQVKAVLALGGLGLRAASRLARESLRGTLLAVRITGCHTSVLICASQVKAVLATILSSVQQQVAGSTHSSSSSRLPAGYDPTLASRWAAANPPGSCGCSSSDSNNGNSSSSSEQQGAGEAAPDDTRQAAPAPTDAGAAAQDAAASVPQPDAPAVDTARLCVHFYSPGTYALLSAVYSQARELLQPTPPAPVDPPKKGEGGGCCCPTHDITLPACTCSLFAQVESRESVFTC